jgi:glutamate dehydrogenase
MAAGVPAALASRIACADGLLDALDIAEVSDASRRSFDEVCEVHVALGARLGLARLRSQIDTLPAGSFWSNRAKAALGDDLAGLQRSLAQQVLTTIGAADAAAAASIERWMAGNAGALERAQRLLADLAETKNPDLAMLSVALRELRNLA